MLRSPFKTFKSDDTLLEHLPHPQYGLALSDRDLSSAHIDTGEVKNLFHAVKFICYLLTVSANLSAKDLKAECLGDFHSASRLFGSGADSKKPILTSVGHGHAWMNAQTTFVS